MELHDLLNDYGDIGDLPPERRMLVATLNCIVAKQGGAEFPKG